VVQGGLFLGNVDNHHPTGKWLNSPNPTTLDVYIPSAIASGSNMERTKHTGLH
jgi:hypothetical protein